MKRILTLALAASTAFAAPVMAYQSQAEGQQTEPRQPSVLERVLDRVLGPAPQQETQTTTPTTQTGPAPTLTPMESVLAADFRAEDRARDQYRHPAETLNFFRIDPSMTVAEYGPGGGWYTRVLAPYIAPRGRYIALNTGFAGRGLTEEQVARSAAWAPAFPATVQQWTGVPASRVTAMTSDDIGDTNAGSVDRVLIFRSLHGLRNANLADTELRRIRTLLADDGLVGVVQHRAPESESWARSNGSRGYLKQSDVIKLFQLNGFELVSASEINANPRDTANWEQGVWTLPPTYTLGDQDRARYTSIGESDRMTLLFRKAR